ncbi:MAG: hypothetical protein AAF604_21320 [Acidobacteriota bacterium]
MRHALGLCLLTALACQSTASMTVPGGEPFRLAVGESARLEDSDLKVVFEAVIGDSRCPRGVQCVWAGEATIRLTARLGDQTFESELTTQKPEGELAGHRCRLLAVDPYPVHGEEIAPEDYAVRLELTPL